MTNVTDISAFGLYIHWPFCRSKCPYCDFFSRVDNKVNQDDLVEEYLQQIEFYARFTEGRGLTSIFFGGGTPSLLTAKNVEKIINQAGKFWSLSPEVEISLEANPNTNKNNLFADLKQAGINRLSLGVQALNEVDLKFLGRTHSLEQALDSAEDVVKIFDNHSMDLIYARPNQQISQWMDELQQAVSLGFKHLSLYQLTIEEGTAFARKGVKAMEEDAATELYNQTNQFLSESGYPRYEVSNYAVPQNQCRHNLLYWRGQDYIGIGQGAHGRFQYNKENYAQEYKKELIKLSAEEKAEELIIMGLRIEEGISKQRFQQSCGLNFDDFINKIQCKNLEEQNLVVNTPQFFRLTSSGFLVLDYIIEALCF